MESVVVSDDDDIDMTDIVEHSPKQEDNKADWDEQRRRRGRRRGQKRKIEHENSAPNQSINDQSNDSNPPITAGPPTKRRKRGNPQKQEMDASSEDDEDSDLENVENRNNRENGHQSNMNSTSTMPRQPLTDTTRHNTTENDRGNKNNSVSNSTTTVPTESLRDTESQNVPEPVRFGDHVVDPSWHDHSEQSSRRRRRRKRNGKKNQNENKQNEIDALSVKSKVKTVKNQKKPDEGSSDSDLEDNWSVCSEELSVPKKAEGEPLEILSMGTFDEYRKKHFADYRVEDLIQIVKPIHPFSEWNALRKKGGPPSHQFAEIKNGTYFDYFRFEPFPILTISDLNHFPFCIFPICTISHFVDSVICTISIL